MTPLPMLGTRAEIEARLAELRRVRLALLGMPLGHIGATGIDGAIQFYEWRLTNVDAVIPD